jgi:hypothetical protein
MWVLIKALLAKWALFKILLKTLGSLAWLFPVALLLKTLGLPMLLLLLVLALPIFIVLALFGLPFILVLVVGGVLLAGFVALLTFGFTLLKILVPIILVVWVIRWLLGNGKKSNGADPATE